MRRYGGARYKGSMSLEAAIAVPVFIFAAATIISLFDAMHCARRMQAVAEKAAKDLSQYAYTARYMAGHPGFSGSAGEGADGSVGEGLENLREEDGGGGAPPEALDAGADVLTEAGIHAYVMAAALSQRPHDRIINILSWGSGYDEEKALIQVRIRYDYRFPFSFFGLLKLPQRVLGQRRAWIGKSNEGEGDGGGDGEEERMVFVGRTSTRYHLRASCHYLDNQMRVVNLEHLDFERNDAGGCYFPCSRCADGGGGPVYLFPSGSAYHQSPSCSAIHAYVRMAPLSEVSHLGVCSYCGGE